MSIADNTIQIGAYWASTFFSDVSPYNPTEFTTCVGTAWPDELVGATINGYDAATGGFIAGTGGASAINWTLLLKLASPPRFGGHSHTEREFVGEAGNPMFIRSATHPSRLTFNIELPRADLDETTHTHYWNRLKKLVFTKARCWLLYDRWAVCGFISNAPQLFDNRKLEPVETIDFRILWYYSAYESGGHKVYERFICGGA